MYSEILRAIINGELLIYEEKHFSTPSLDELQEKIEKERIYFANNMTDTDKSRFEDFENLLLDRMSEYNEEYFYQKIMIGISIGMEIAEYKHKIIKEYEVS